MPRTFGALVLCGAMGSASALWGGPISVAFVVGGYICGILVAHAVRADLRAVRKGMGVEE